MRLILGATAVVALLTVGLVTPVEGQVGTGLLDANTATGEELAALPHLSEGSVASLIAARPFASVVELDALLTAVGLSAEQVSEVYGKAFVHVNLDDGTGEEFLLIPGVGGRMAHEFDEYRPWRNWAHFDREIGKYVDGAEVARLKTYLFIPIDLNSASDEDLATIPGVGRRMVHELTEYRPWTTQQQFEREIGKYVDETEVARLWRYVVIR